MIMSIVHHREGQLLSNLSAKKYILVDYRDPTWRSYRMKCDLRYLAKGQVSPYTVNEDRESVVTCATAKSKLLITCRVNEGSGTRLILGSADRRS